MQKVMLDKLNGCSFLIKADDLLEKYNTIWGNVCADIKKEFDSELVYNKNYLKSKIEAHGDEVTDFCDKKVTDLDFNHTCFGAICQDSALKKEDNYSRVFLKECKHIEEKVVRSIQHDFSYSFDESDEEQMFFDKYLTWLFFRVLLTRKYTYKF